MNIMLCVPTSLIDHNKTKSSETEIMARQRHIVALKQLMKTLEATGHNVYCFLSLIGWERTSKTKLSSPKVAIARDWDEVHRAHHVIACPCVNGGASRGVHVEIGWATALKKPVTLLLHKPKANHSVLVTGLPTHGDLDVTALYYEDDPSDVFREVSKRIQTIQKRLRLKICKTGD